MADSIASQLEKELNNIRLLQMDSKLGDYECQLHYHNVYKLEP